MRDESDSPVLLPALKDFTPRLNNRTEFKAVQNNSKQFISSQFLTMIQSFWSYYTVALTEISMAYAHSQHHCSGKCWLYCAHITRVYTHTNVLKSLDLLRLCNAVGYHVLHVGIP